MEFTEKEIVMEHQILNRQTNPADETIHLGGLAMRFLLTGNDTNGSVASAELTVAGGQKLMAPAHSHSHYEESIYGLEGVVVWTVDGQEIEVGPGQMLCIPRGAIHKFENRGERDARSLCIITPAAIGPEYFREVRDQVAAAGGGPPDRAKIAEIMMRHGLVPVVS